MDGMNQPNSFASFGVNKGCFGSPLSGGGSELSLVEAAYLLENDRLKVKRSRKGRDADLPFLLKRGISKDPRFMENYLVFRDIRNRGLIVQGTERNCFVTYPRGKRPSNGKADAWIAKKLSTLGVGLVFTAAGIPMIFQGQELLEDQWFHDKDPIDWARKDRFAGIIQLYKDLFLEN